MKLTMANTKAEFLEILDKIKPFAGEKNLIYFKITDCAVMAMNPYSAIIMLCDVPKELWFTYVHSGTYEVTDVELTWPYDKISDILDEALGQRRITTTKNAMMNCMRDNSDTVFMTIGCTLCAFNKDLLSSAFPFFEDRIKASIPINSCSPLVLWGNDLQIIIQPMYVNLL
jgi:hypothetical protein